MLNDLITFFTGSPQNRRKYVRRQGPFQAWVAAGNAWQPVVCIDVSGSGLGIATTGAIENESTFRVVLENRPFLIRAKCVWKQPGTQAGKAALRYGMVFTGISADDWDAIIRFCNNESVSVENKAQQDLELVRMQPDDVARPIPKKLQDYMLAQLVAHRRLAPLDEKTPLVQYSYGGIVKHGNLTLHQLTITSRFRDDVTGDVKTFNTCFRFDDQGANVTIDD